MKYHIKQNVKWHNGIETGIVLEIGRDISVLWEGGGVICYPLEVADLFIK